MSNRWLKGVIYNDRLSPKDIEIKELKKEIERLNNIIKKGITEEMKDELDIILKCNQKQAHRIDEAIEYINTMPLTKGTEWYRIELLDILKGVDKE